jgi:hypothetical protein
MMLANCGDSLLDKSPNGLMSPATFYKTESDMVQAINAAYVQLAESHARQAIIHPAIWSDETVKGSSGPSDQADLVELDIHSIITSNGLVATWWRQYYQGIFRANIALEYLEGTDFSLTNRLIGEAKFLRALWYFYLNIRWNGVPLITSTSTEQLKDVTRSSAAEIYAFIEQELLDAISLLPVSYTGADLGRATKGSAQGLLGRMYLFTQEWQKAADVYSDIINSKTYRLMDDYAEIFAFHNDNIAESLFEVQYTTRNSGNYNNATASWYMPRLLQPWDGNGFSEPTQAMFDAYEPGDIRRGISIMAPGDDMWGIDTYKAEYSMATGFSTRKYVNGAADEDLADPSYTESNFKIIRYAEVLLGYAEAVYRGASGRADITGLEALNSVRQRVGMPGIPALTFEAIVHERRVELAFESFRFFDLVRWGLAKDVLGNTFDVNHDEYFPIPQSEILINPNLTQNPGY